jgi:hypothetical protein
MRELTEIPEFSWQGIDDLVLAGDDLVEEQSDLCCKLCRQLGHALQKWSQTFEEVTGKVYVSSLTLANA